MNIALDYDNTFTADDNLWSDFILRAEELGHRIYIFTSRSAVHDRNDHLDVLNDSGRKVIYCDGLAKREIEEFLKDVQPTFTGIDIWIDDKPESIVEDSPNTPEQLAEWRRTRAA